MSSDRKRTLFLADGNSNRRSSSSGGGFRSDHNELTASTTNFPLPPAKSARSAAATVGETRKFRRDHHPGMINLENDFFGFSGSSPAVSVSSSSRVGYGQQSCRQLVSQSPYDDGVVSQSLSSRSRRGSKRSSRRDAPERDLESGRRPGDEECAPPPPVSPSPFRDTLLHRRASNKMFRANAAHTRSRDMAEGRSRNGDTSGGPYESLSNRGDSEELAISKKSKKASREKSVSSENSEADGLPCGGGILGVLIGSWPISIFFVSIPFGIIAYWLQWGSMWVFSLNFIAIVPQAWIMGKATEDLAMSYGQIIGGLLNAWFGNIVEMLLCIAGLRQAELVVVRSTLIGSILSNLLLVTGCSFLFGGLKYKIQEFSAIGASTNSSLMTLGCLCLGLPTMYATVLSSAETSTLQISRTVAIFLVFIYLQYMVFQLKTHSFLFEEDEDPEEPDLDKYTAIAVLGVCTVCCAANSEYLISAIEGVVNEFDLSKEFIGIILLPIIGNAAEHYTSVVVAMSDKMDLSIACAVGSSCQMALFVTPMTVLAGWIMGQPMSLDLHAFEVLVLLFAVLVLSSILQDGYSNWLEGSMLVSAYTVIAITYFFEEPKYSEII